MFASFTAHGYRTQALRPERIDLREGHLVADIEADRSTMAARRWADAVPHNGEPQ